MGETAEEDREMIAQLVLNKMEVIMVFCRS